MSSDQNDVHLDCEQSQPATENQETDLVLDQLAALSPLDYDRERAPAAKRLGVRVAILDAEVDKLRVSAIAAQPANSQMLSILADVEPWPDPIDGSVLLDELTKTLAQFAILPDGAGVAIALWVLFAHTHDAAEHSPILAFESPEKRCGKTTTLSVVADLVPRALPAANISRAALFRTVEKYGPTLLIDEGDTFLRGDNDEMRGILNSGFSRSAACVLRCDGEQNEPRMFGTWCPKLIALIGTLPDTLRDRSIVVTLRGKLDHEEVERFTRARRDEVRAIGAKCARWATDHLSSLVDADPEMPKGLNDRAADRWRHLLAIADRAGVEWPKRAREAANKLAGASEDMTTASEGVLLLMHIREVFQSQGKERITSTDLAAALNNNEHWPWGELRNGKPITPRGVARILSRYGLKPHKARDANRYWTRDFEDPWERYLDPVASNPPDACSTSSTKFEKMNNTNKLEDAQRLSRTSTADLTVEVGDQPGHSENTIQNNQLMPEVELAEHAVEGDGRQGLVNGRTLGDGEAF